jgi:hypothetical protein
MFNYASAFICGVISNMASGMSKKDATLRAIEQADQDLLDYLDNLEFDHSGDFESLLNALI